MGRLEAEVAPNLRWRGVRISDILRLLTQEKLCRISLFQPEPLASSTAAHPLKPNTTSFEWKQIRRLWPKWIWSSRRCARSFRPVASSTQADRPDSQEPTVQDSHFT